MSISGFFEQLAAALTDAPNFVAEAETVMDVWVCDEPWVVRMESTVVECYPGEWSGGAAPVIRCPSPETWAGMVSAPETIGALVAAGLVTMDDSADPSFWWPRWARMLEIRRAWAIAHGEA